MPLCAFQEFSDLGVPLTDLWAGALNCLSNRNPKFSKDTRG